jgi:hypothetical protein
VCVCPVPIQFVLDRFPFLYRSALVNITSGASEIAQFVLASDVKKNVLNLERERERERLGIRMNEAIGSVSRHFISLARRLILISLSSYSYLPISFFLILSLSSYYLPVSLFLFLSPCLSLYLDVSVDDGRRHGMEVTDGL